MHEHVIQMTSLVKKPEDTGLNADNSFLVPFIINSLSSEYGSFQMNYVNELHRMLVQEEIRIKNGGAHKGTHSAHLINDKGTKKKDKRNQGRSERTGL